MQRSVLHPRSRPRFLVHPYPSSRLYSFSSLFCFAGLLAAVADCLSSSLAGCCFPFMSCLATRAHPTLFILNTFCLPTFMKPRTLVPSASSRTHSAFIVLVRPLLTFLRARRSIQQVDQRPGVQLRSLTLLFSGCPCFPSPFRPTLDLLFNRRRRARKRSQQRADDAFETQKPAYWPPPTTHAPLLCVSRSVLCPPPCLTGPHWS